MKEEFLFCRMMGTHSYERFWPEEELLPVYPYFVLSWRCVHCNMIRIDGFDRRGDLTYRRYIQPDGYRIPANKKPSRSKLRLQYYRRTSSAISRRG